MTYRIFTVLNLGHLKKTTQPNRNRTATVLKCIVFFRNVVNSLEPSETPSYSASNQAPNYVKFVKAI